MRNIAFKRAKHSPQVASSLHPEFITEYAYTDLFAEGFHKPEDGYEILSEDEFKVELSMNESNQSNFQVQRELERQLQDKALAKAQRKEEKDYQKFLKWKLDNGME